MFNPVNKPLNEIPNSSLAYIGDAYYELFLRSLLLSIKGGTSGSLHRQGIKLANAGFQANLLRELQQLGRLTTLEQDVVQRGKNSNPGTMAKHSTPIDYRMATGLETLVGWLCLNNQETRVAELIEDLLRSAINESEKNNG